MGALTKWIWCFIFSAPLLGQSLPKRPIPQEPTPQIEYDEPTRYDQDYFQFSVELSMVTPKLIETATQMEKTRGGFPSLFVSARQPLFRWGGLQAVGELKVGAGIDRGQFQITSNSLLGNSRYSEQSRVFWAPALISMEWSYPLTALPFLKPAFSVGVGGQFLSQKNSSGVIKESWSGLLVLRPSLFFLHNSDPNDWFGGFTFGATRWEGIGPTRLSAWSVDTALLFNL